VSIPTGRPRRPELEANPPCYSEWQGTLSWLGYRGRPQQQKEEERRENNSKNHVVHVTISNRGLRILPHIDEMIDGMID
jgi:hypothetical protein